MVAVVAAVVLAAVVAVAAVVSVVVVPYINIAGTSIDAAVVGAVLLLWLLLSRERSPPRTLTQDR